MHDDGSAQAIAVMGSHGEASISDASGVRPKGAPGRSSRPTSGTTSSLPEGIHRHLGPRPRSNAPSQSLPRTEQAPHAVPSPVDLANATCSVQTDPTAVCVPS